MKLGPNVHFNQDVWVLDFADTATKLKLLCEQWLYASPCGCKDDPDYEVCETCESCDVILQTIKSAPCIKW